MRKYIVLIIVVALLMPSGLAQAHPGRTDSAGGHTCKTKCSEWGLEYGEYHFHNKDVKATAKREAKKVSKLKAKN